MPAVPEVLKTNYSCDNGFFVKTLLCRLYADMCLCHLTESVDGCGAASGRGTKNELLV
jgi:hypothetical protein